jgi:hypothetical protein
MNHHQITCFAGFDWAKDHHDVVVLDASGNIIDQFRFSHTFAGSKRSQPTPVWASPSRRVSVPWSNNCWKAA